jgi:integrase
LKGRTVTAVRATKLSEEQVQLAEVSFVKLGDDWERILDAVDYWMKHGRQQAVTESPRIDDAVKQFSDWLDDSDYRDRTQDNLRSRVNVFASSIGNIRIADITPDLFLDYLGKRNVSRTSKDNDRRALSRFFGWCAERPRHWTAINAARKENRERRPTNGTAPVILSVAEAETLLRAAEARKGGCMVPYVAVCLFAGLRPTESVRLTWAAVNLHDKEIRLEGDQTKTGRPRVVAINATLAGWLEAHRGKDFCPSNWRKDFAAIQAAAGWGTKTAEQPDLKRWTPDIMRHTAVSHYFRACGSYGRTAEEFGNSEAIIKRHYQGRVSTEDTKAFYAILPAKKVSA